MDDRQQQVQVGAGLQESRLNTEFIDFLKKYGSYGIYALLAVVLAFVGMERWKLMRTRNLDTAFADLDAAMTSRSPDSLLKVADEHKGQGAVWQLATLTAAEYYLDAVRKGYAPTADPVAPAESDRLTESQTEELLNKTTGLLKDVLAKIGSDKSQVLSAQRARWNLVTAALNANDPATAKKYLAEYESAAKAADLKDMVAIATTRSASIDKVLMPVALYSSTELPKPPAAEGDGVKVPGMGTFNVTGGTGRPITITPEELEKLREGGQLVPLDGQDPTKPIFPVPGAEDPNQPQPVGPPAEPKPVGPETP